MTYGSDMVEKKNRGRSSVSEQLQGDVRIKIELANRFSKLLGIFLKLKHTHFIRDTPLNGCVDAESYCNKNCNF